MKRIALSMGLKSFCKKAKVVFYIILLINLYSLLVPHESVCQLVSDFRVNQDTFINVSKDYAKISTNKAGQTVIVWNDYSFRLPGRAIAGYDRVYARTEMSINVTQFWAKTIVSCG